MKTLLCATLDANEAKRVEVESSLVRALPSFSIVGLASSSIQEAKERVKAALVYIGFRFPPQKLTINLSPSDLKKQGSHFDLPIALAVALQKEKTKTDGFYTFGELGLDGKVKDTLSIFPLVLSLARKEKNIRVVAPKESRDKLSKIPGIELYCIDTLKDAISFFKERNLRSEPAGKIEAESIKIDEVLYYYQKSFEYDFIDVKGQEVAKRAALVSAAGFHNILFEGSPGCGKSMISKRLRYILPPLSLEEILEIAKLEAMDTKEPGFRPLRPFRSPHHTSTRASIFGGGTLSARIGEVALSNRGILFFDELPHFPKSVLEALREPLEDNRILISRVNTKTEYETKFLFAAAQNPCPCGNLMSSSKECRCSELEIQRYKNRLSEPFLDRLDIYVRMNETSQDDKSTVSSKEMFEKVLEAFVMQKRRGQRDFNGKLNEKEIEEYCMLDEEAQEILQKAVSKFSLSFRSINKIKRVSRTIADLNGKEKIGKSDLFEALSYRKRAEI
ncbi:YifB family Mg chelatase-like AAA ATPase [Nitrosophilus alvini]|uniref:YifB family Mg chelatase-like AAA ATPase n=1 Tax=Nitrosophilus alvini TaxID=2714855 RepID=UPI00190ACA92|nr:YifB family Mg chelatase-like AAA ATPase [Nitrosophilus alvini]